MREYRGLVPFFVRWRHRNSNRHGVVDGTESFLLVPPLDTAAALADADALLIGNSIGSTELDELADPLIEMAKALYDNIEGGTTPPPPLSDPFATSSADDSSPLSIPLTPPGVGHLNAFKGGPVFLGGLITIFDPGSGFPQQPFGSTGPDIPGGDSLTPELIITVVPEPTSYLLAMLAALFVAALRRPAGTSGR